VLHGSIARRAGSQLVLTDEFGSAVFTAQLANGAWSVHFTHPLSCYQAYCTALALHASGAAHRAAKGAPGTVPLSPHRAVGVGASPTGSPRGELPPGMPPPGGKLFHREGSISPRARGGGLHHQESPTTGVPFAHLADLGNADGALPTRGVTLGALGDSFMSPDEAAARTPPSAARSGAAPQSADLPSRLRESGVLARI